MIQALWIAAAVLWLVWCTQAVLSVLINRKFAKLFRQPRRESFDRYRPTAAVIIPVKGLEPNLDANLYSLCNQDYPDYRLIFVIESESDPAYPLLTNLSDNNSHRRIDIVCSGTAPLNQGQKTHNQIAALKFLDDVDTETQVIAFADTDAVPGQDWLGDLVGPLEQAGKTALTTGYRWFIPHPDQTGRISIFNHFASIMNSTIAGFCGRDEWNHAWGGSMALRRETAKQGELIRRWTGALSDDYQITQMCRELGQRIYFVPRCLIASPVSFNFKSLIEFARRQYIITRVHTPSLYVISLLLHMLYLCGFTLSWLVLILGLVISPTNPAWLYALTAILTVFTANQTRSSYRRAAIQDAFDQATADKLQTTLWIDRWLTIAWVTLHFLIILRASCGRTLTWRKIHYELYSPKQIRRLDPETT